MSPNTPHIPEILKTKRLILRCPEPSNAEGFNLAISESLPELRPWFPWAVEQPTIVDSQNFLKYARSSFSSRQELNWLIFLKTTSTIVGVVSLHDFNWTVPKCMVSYWARTSYTRQGYITEAVDKTSELAFDNLGAKRVEISCDGYNERSQALARRCGFEYEGTLRCDFRDHIHNELRDSMIFAKVRRD